VSESGEKSKAGYAMTPRQVEMLFCLSILAEGPDVASCVLGRFLDYCKHKDEVIAKIGGDG